MPAIYLVPAIAMQPKENSQPHLKCSPETVASQGNRAAKNDKPARSPLPPGMVCQPTNACQQARLVMGWLWWPLGIAGILIPFAIVYQDWLLPSRRRIGYEGMRRSVRELARAEFAQPEENGQP